MKKIPLVFWLMLVSITLVIAGTFHDTKYIQDLIFKIDATFRIGDATHRALEIYTVDISATDGDFIGDLYTGPVDIDEDSGAIAVMDMPVSATPDAGTEESYVFQIDDVTILKIYAEADGAGGIQNEANIIEKRLVLKPSSVQAIAAATTIYANASYIRVIGDGGAVTCTSDPTVSAGILDGQRVLIQGTHDTNTVEIQDETNNAGSTLELAGNANCILGLGDTIELIWDNGDSKWYELTRSNN